MLPFRICGNVAAREAILNLRFTCYYFETLLLLRHVKRSWRRC